MSLELTLIGWRRCWRCDEEGLLAVGDGVKSEEDGGRAGLHWAVRLEHGFVGVSSLGLLGEWVGEAGLYIGGTILVGASGLEYLLEMSTDSSGWSLLILCALGPES